MTLVKWTPRINRPLVNVFEDMERWMDQVFGTTPVSDDAVSWRPAFDVHETDKEYILTADLPGMDKKDVNITVSDGVLEVSGERKFEKEENKDYYYREIRYGKFCRRFNLPEDANQEDIKAKFKNGVLTLNIAKAEVAQPEVKKIAIK